MAFERPSSPPVFATSLAEARISRNGAGADPRSPETEHIVKNILLASALLALSPAIAYAQDAAPPAGATPTCAEALPQVRVRPMQAAGFPAA